MTKYFFCNAFPCVTYIWMMKNSAVILLLALHCLGSAAQVRIADFRQSYSDGAASDVRTSVADPTGQPCAVLKMETSQSGWTFDAGLAGIMDTRYEKGCIWLYVPASARKITVAHQEYGVLRDWIIPASLESGRTYTMRLLHERRRTASSAPAPKPEPVRVPRYEVPTVRPAPSFPDKPDKSLKSPSLFDSGGTKHFCSSFVDLNLGFDEDEACTTVLRYTSLKNRVGWYAGIGIDYNAGGMFVGGAAFRLTDEYRTFLDIQLYAGAGIGEIGMLEAGVRFAFKSETGISSWDFGMGVQLCDGVVMPTLELGLCIWGVPLLCALCIGLSAE